MTNTKRKPVIPDLSNTEYLWAKIAPNIRKLDSGCWEWTGQLQHDGYGLVTVKTIDGNVTTAKAHRVMYALKHGETPVGKHLHHKCHHDQECEDTYRCPHRRCVNPDHVTPKTPKEHSKEHQLTRCKYGHPFSGSNLHVTPQGKRECRQCRRRIDKDHRNRVPRTFRRGDNKKECKHGHPWIEQNIRVKPNGHKCCKLCDRASSHKQNEARRAAKIRKESA